MSLPGPHHGHSVIYQNLIAGPATVRPAACPRPDGLGHFERFVDFEAFRQCCSVYQVGCFRAEPLFFRE